MHGPIAYACAQNHGVAMSKPIATLALLAALAAPLGACAGGQTSEAAAVPSQCFDAAQITGYQVLDRETLLLRVGPSSAYHVKITGVCPDIDWSQKIGIQGETGSQICLGRDVTLITPSLRGGTQECYANEILMAPPMPVPAS